MQDSFYTRPSSSSSRHPSSMHHSSLPSSSYSDQPFPSKLPLSRQPSLDLFSILNSGLSAPSLSRQASFSFSSSFPPMEEDPFSFSFGDFDGAFKAGALDEVDPLHSGRVSSYDSDVSSAWSSSGSEEGSAPLSPHSSNDSLSDASSQSSDDLFTHPVEGHWAHEEPDRATVAGAVKDDFTRAAPFAAAGRFSELQRSGPSAASPIPVLPLPFTPTVYAFNYHSAEEEPAPSTSSSARHERREGLRGGGASRGAYDRHMDAAHGSGHHHHSESFSPSISSTTTTSTAPSAPSSPYAPPSTISPKSLLLSLSSSRQSHSSSPLSSHHYSASSHPSSPYASIPAPYLDPNEVVIGIYTRAERAAKIARYREKRANRQWKKKIMYGCRKSFADNRPRVGGRFIKMKPEEADSSSSKKGRK